MLFYELKIICSKTSTTLLIVTYVTNLVKGFLLGFIMFKNIFKSITLLGFMDESFKNKGFFSLECDFKRYLSRGTIFF